MNLLFVCSGNICRSPMVAEYCRHRAAARGLGWLVIDSAGTLGIDDRAAPEPHPATAAKRSGTSLTAHFQHPGSDVQRRRSRARRVTQLNAVGDPKALGGMEREGP